MDEDKMVFRVSILTFFRSNGKKGHLEKYYFRYCYGNFCGILNAI